MARKEGRISNTTPPSLPMSVHHMPLHRIPNILAIIMSLTAPRSLASNLLSLSLRITLEPRVILLLLLGMRPLLLLICGDGVVVGVDEGDCGLKGAL